MDLKAWVAASPLTAGQIAADLGVTRLTLHRWSTGVMMPRPGNVAAIERYTNGRVRPRDMVANYQAVNVSL